MMRMGFRHEGWIGVFGRCLSSMNMGMFLRYFTSIIIERCRSDVKFTWHRREHHVLLQAESIQQPQELSPSTVCSPCLIQAL